MTAPQLDRFAAEIRRLDAVLRPIAKGPGVDITTPGWSKRLAGHPQEPWRPALDRAGIRTEAEALLRDVIEAYAQAGEADRAAIRGLFRTHDSFAWAATLPHDPLTAEQLREQLLLFSIDDQGHDFRDAILRLDRLCAGAAAAQLRLVPALEEAAQLSSADNPFAPFGGGSTRDMLRERIRRIQTQSAQQ